MVSALASDVRFNRKNDSDVPTNRKATTETSCKTKSRGPDNQRYPSSESFLNFSYSQSHLSMFHSKDVPIVVIPKMVLNLMNSNKCLSKGFIFFEK